MGIKCSWISSTESTARFSLKRGGVHSTFKLWVPSEGGNRDWSVAGPLVHFLKTTTVPNVVMHIKWVWAFTDLSFCAISEVYSYGRCSIGAKVTVLLFFAPSFSWQICALMNYQGLHLPNNWPVYRVVGISGRTDCCMFSVEITPHCWKRARYPFCKRYRGRFGSVGRLALPVVINLAPWFWQDCLALPRRLIQGLAGPLKSCSIDCLPRR